MGIHERPRGAPVRAKPSLHPAAGAPQHLAAAELPAAMLELQRRAGNQAVVRLLHVQRAKWTWNGSAWTSPDGDEQNKPAQPGTQPGETYDDQTKTFAAAPSATATPRARGNFRNMGLTIAVPGHQSLTRADPAAFLATQQTLNFSDLGGPDVAARGIAAVKSLPGEAVAALSPTALSWFHGSTSPSLAFLSRTKGLLLGAPQLMEQGLVPFGGEVGNSLDPRGVNRFGVSGVTPSHINEAVGYTDPSQGRISDVALSSRSPGDYVKELAEAILKATDDLLSEKLAHLTVGKLKVAIGRQCLLANAKEAEPFLTEIRLGFEKVAQSAKGETQLGLVQGVSGFLTSLGQQPVASPEERTQLGSPFPVLYGSSSLLGTARAMPVNSSISGEHVVDKPALGSDIAFIFVPLDQVEATTVSTSKFGVKVLPLEAVTFLTRLARVAGCTLDQAAETVRKMS